MKNPVLLLACLCWVLPAQAQQQGQAIRFEAVPSQGLFKGAMPDLPKADRLEARVRPFTVRPGMIDAMWHSHPTSIVGYVIDGVVAIEIKGQGISQFKAGKLSWSPPIP